MFIIIIIIIKKMLKKLFHLDHKQPITVTLFIIILYYVIL